MSSRWLTIVGIGDGGLATLTPEARAALGTATTIFGGRRHLAMLGDHRARRVEWLQPFARSIAALAARRGQPTVVLATGDPMWFGVGATLSRTFPPEEMRVLAAPSAFSLAAARLGWPLEEAECLTVHGRPVEAVARRLQPGARLLILSEDGESPRALARLLTSRGYGPSRLAVLEHLGGPKERLREATASAFDLSEVADLNTVAVECRPGRAAEARPPVPGLPDESFVHDGKMTKRVLRALAIAALGPVPGDLLWDVGAGSGSISVEWLRSGPRLRALAVEPVEARRAMIAENAAAFGVPELEIVEGRAPAAFAALEAPDAVFLGGGLTDGVFAAAFAALKPGGRLVAHAVTLESEAILIGLQAEHGGELMRVSVERAEPVGPYRGFKPAMTVVHWHMTKGRGVTGRLYGIGVGPGDPELLTLKALRILKAAPVVAYPASESGPSIARRIVASHLPGGQEEIEILVPMRLARRPAQEVYDAAAVRIAARLDAGRDVAVLCEGDPFFYGSFMYLFERLAERHPVEIVPGVSSLNAAAARTLRPLAARNDVLAVIPAPLEDHAIEGLLARAEGFAILKLGRHMPRIRALLARLGLEADASYVERATQAGERIVPLREAPEEAPYFALILGYRGAEPALLGLAGARR